ncbi:hypothetical protein N7462_000080 [Penicillium macrosclerotiorum]|uniref:uncharacterized protein n=1 Tax=Penicillium macrosclerotiorum TaxID=303699 RepID=UPI00254709D4|nr:uncharacterized protein N7462_000080 [Penicillium macrosclerotiorum]KAJ5698075.1 hypothetical protein N7462_000080 [Penicillium macrosclerotiorum]
MSLNTPSNPASPPSQTLLDDPPTRPVPSSLPSDQIAHGPDELSIDRALQAAQPTAAPPYDSTPDESPGEKHENEAKQQSPPLKFQPFFTLIEDAHASDYHHPTVHYIFSDDDTDIVTEAAMRSLAAQQEITSGTAQDRTHTAQQGPEDHAEDGKPTLLPPVVPGVQENYIVLDVEPILEYTEGNPATDHPATKSVPSPPANPSTLAGHTSPGQTATPTQFRVTSAKSFSPTWQVLNSEMVPAPTFENHDAGDVLGNGLMLKIHGTGGIPADAGKGRDGQGTQKLEDMMERFAVRMRELQMIIDAAEMPLLEESQLAEGQGAPDTKLPTEDSPGEEALQKETDE